METVAILVAAVLGVVLVARDVWLRRVLAALRAELTALRSDAREQEQLASVGQLVSGLAQELKSPLQGVIGNTELMLAMGTYGIESSNDLREIQENATRAVVIVRNLLAFTETTALSRRWQDINELLDRAIGGIRSELDVSGVRVQFERSDRLPLMYVDGRQLEKVIATLLSRPAPRSVARLEVAAVTLAARRADLDDRLVIEVDDRTATDPSDEAMWSGDLAACRQIVHAHGGSLEVEHPANGGFRFHLELPIMAVGAETRTPVTR
jgi:signal transduction histidine kinase